MKVIRFIPVVLLSVGLLGCSYTPKVAYDPILVKTQTVSNYKKSSPKKSGKKSLHRAKSQNWSVITDPVLLDIPPEQAPKSTAETANVYIADSEFQDINLYNPTFPTDGGVDLMAEAYPNQSIDAYSYYPVSYSSYWYYPSYYPSYSPYQNTWWYYDDYVNNPFPYGYQPTSWYGGGYSAWGYPYSRYPYGGTYAVVYDDPYYYSAYSSGYYPASFYSPLDDYNPYWAYGYNDYWRGYSPMPYWRRYGYSPHYAYGDPYYGHYWNPWYWDDDYYDDDRKDDDREKRGTRPMVPDRRDKIRLSSTGEDAKESTNTAAYRLNRVRSNEKQRESSTSRTTREARRQISDRQAPRVTTWSLPPLYRSQNSNANASGIQRSSAGRTLRTSREPKTLETTTLSPTMTRESQRQNTSSGWIREDSSNSRVSTWRSERTTAPSYTSPSSQRAGSTIVVPPSARRSSNSIRILPSQQQQRSYSPISPSRAQTSNPNMGRASNMYEQPRQSYSAPVTQQAQRPSYTPAYTPPSNTSSSPSRISSPMRSVPSSSRSTPSVSVQRSRSTQVQRSSSYSRPSQSSRSSSSSSMSSGRSSSVSTPRSSSSMSSSRSSSPSRSAPSTPSVSRSPARSAPSTSARRR